MTIVCKNTSQCHFIFLFGFCLCGWWNGLHRPVLSYANSYIYNMGTSLSFRYVRETLLKLKRPFLLAALFPIICWMLALGVMGASSHFFRCVRNTFLMASVRGNKNYDLAIVSGLLRMSGRIHRQSLASTHPMLQAWVSMCNFRYVPWKRHWHHHSSPTTSQITKTPERFFHSACLSLSPTIFPFFPSLFSTLWSTLCLGAVLFHR